MKPELRIRTDLVEFLQGRGWHTEILHGSQFQSGIPDLLIGHLRHGTRWIDTKVPGKYSFTKAQIDKWPKWEAVGIGVWIITAASEEEYAKLFQPPNFRQYWKKSYGQLPDINKLIEELRSDNKKVTPPST
jgi:hypothetical protein